MSIAHHHGELKEVTLPNGKVIKREEWLVVMQGENIALVKQVPDSDHFLYQNQMPVSQKDLIEKYGGILPKHLLGESLRCTCGSDGVVLLDGPYANMAICRIYLTTGFHQTSHTIKDGKLELNKKAQSERLADVKDIIENYVTYKPKL